MSDEKRHPSNFILLLFLLVLCVLLWRSEVHYQRLTDRMATALETLAKAVSHQPAMGSGANNNTPVGELGKALADLGNRDAVKRYQAATKLREMGSEAIPGLMDVVRGGDGRSRDAALMTLLQMEDPAAAAGDFRELVEIYFSPGANSPGLRPGQKTVATGLIILGKAGNEEDIALFRRGLKDADQTIRAAAVVAVREAKAVDALPDLLALLGNQAEHDIIRGEIRKTIVGLAASSPQNFDKAVAAMPPKQRFELTQVLGAAENDDASEPLKKLAGDEDPRVSLAAARLLGKRGDKTATDIVKRLLEGQENAEIRRLAEEILKEVEGNKP